MKGFKEPKAKVLGRKAVVPDDNLIRPAPNQFTHEVKRAQGYYFKGAHQGGPPDGEFAEGTEVVLLVYDGGGYCRVADGQGLYVETEYEGLKKLK